MVPLVEPPIHDDIRIRGPGAEPEGGGRGELALTPGSDALNVEAVGVASHQAGGGAVRVVVNEHQLHGPLVRLQPEVLEEVLQLDCRRSAGSERRHASDLRDHAGPMRSTELSSSDNSKRTAALATAAAEPQSPLRSRIPSGHRRPMQCSRLLWCCRRHLLLIVLVLEIIYAEL